MCTPYEGTYLQSTTTPRLIQQGRIYSADFSTYVHTYVRTVAAGQLRKPGSPLSGSPTGPSSTYSTEVQAVALPVLQGIHDTALGRQHGLESKSSVKG